MAQMLQFHPVPFPLQLHSASQCVFAVSMLCALQVVGSSGEPSMQELSQPCHDCGAAHLPRTCQQPRCDISNSVCNRWAGWYRVYSHPNVDRAIGQWCSFAALPFQAKAQPDRSIACAPSSPHVAKVYEVTMTTSSEFPRQLDRRAVHQLPASCPFSTPELSCVLVSCTCTQIMWQMLAGALPHTVQPP